MRMQLHPEISIKLNKKAILPALRMFAGGFIIANLMMSSAGETREQWQIERRDPPPNAPMSPWRASSGYDPMNSGYGAGGSVPVVPGLAGLSQNQYSGQIPGQNSFAPGAQDFLQEHMRGKIRPGTVLTGVLDSELSSTKSKQGDIFSLVLENGFFNEGQYLIPPGSRIIGAVSNASPAAMQRHGMPGRLTMNLQTLALPDGRTMPFHGLIEHNPALDQLTEPKTRYRGFNLSDYGQSVKGMLGSFTSGIGSVQGRRMRGAEFLLKAGTPVPVKVNRTLDLNQLRLSSSLPGFDNSSAGFQGGVGGQAPGIIPGLSTPASSTPGVEDPNHIFSTPIRSSGSYGQGEPF